MPSAPRANMMALLKDRNNLNSQEIWGFNVQKQDFYLGKINDANYMEKRWGELCKQKCVPATKVEKRLKAGQAEPCVNCFWLSVGYK